jgi:hypothetical protein
MLIMKSTVVPGRVLNHLIGGIVNDTAHATLRDWKPGNVIHPGDPFGLVLSWLWQNDPDLAVSAFADLIAQLRKWDERATTAITLDAVLDGLPLALQGLSSQEEDDLIDRLRTEVPQHFSADPNLVE